MSTSSNHIGEPLSRVDGKAKVTGAATYAYEYDIKNVAYGVLATSTIAKGTIKSIDTKAAEAAPGVIAIITHLNAIKPAGWQSGNAQTADPRVEGQAFRVFFDDKVHYNGQPVALAIADTFERATYAASLIKAQYIKEKPQTNLKANLSKAVVPKKAEEPIHTRGDKNAFESSEIKVSNQYLTPLQVHNPMEPHAAIAVWEGDDKLTVYNKTQSSPLAQQDMMKAWKLPEENVHIISKFVGGAFGGASRVWPQEMAATIGARQINRP
ncbi:MAG: xanthine dehydrogenase family protein molybdopterin-binding subunit, partial [Mucilaginibacter polytrichastri]|nr:xanthine dehydrogenase family protein molybdopterin-binding subunit [Mucilaginibacter polytrichastri]